MSSACTRSKTVDIEELHRLACLDEENDFLNPVTGFTVMTKYFLMKQKCCGHKCLFCPYGHQNVKNHTCNKISCRFQFEDITQ